MILRLAGMMISPVCALTTSSGIFSFEQDVGERRGQLLVQLVFALLVILHDHLLLPLGFRRRHLVAGDLLLGGNLDVHDDAVGAGRHRQRGVLHVGGLLTEDGAQQAFFRRQFGLALRRDLADENVARLHLGSDADHAVGTEILAGPLR